MGVWKRFGVVGRNLNISYGHGSLEEIWSGGTGFKHQLWAWEFGRDLEWWDEI